MFASPNLAGTGGMLTKADTCTTQHRAIVAMLSSMMGEVWWVIPGLILGISTPGLVRAERC